MNKQVSNRRNLFILAFTLVVVMLGYGMIIPIVPFYIEAMGAGGFELGLLVACYALMRLLFGPLWGSLSDRVGRKPVLMIGVFGYAIALFFFGLATELWMMFAARILSGILSSATAPTTLAYVSDSTSEEDRGGGMGVLGAAVGLGTVLGPGLGGWLSSISLATPFFIAAGLSLVAVALIYLILPESLPQEARHSGGGPGLSLTASQLKSALARPLSVLFVAAFLVTCGITTFFGVFGLYALEQFGYGPQQVGIIIMVTGLISAVGQGGLSGPLTRRFGDAFVIKGSMFLGATSLLLVMWSTSFITLLLSMSFFILVTALTMPSLTALTSKQTTLDQGVTMGLSNSFISLGRIAGPLVGGVIFDINPHYPFIGGAVVIFIGFVISMIWVVNKGEHLTGVSLQTTE